MFMVQAERASVASLFYLFNGTFQRKVENKLYDMILFSAQEDFFSWSYAKKIGT